MDPQEPIFELPDKDGNIHTYVITAHPPSEGAEIVFQIMALVAEPGAALVKKAAEIKGLDAQVGEVLADLDFSELGSAIGSSLSRLHPDVAQKVFRHTTRDGVSLKDSTNYSMAFQRNYSEWLQALIKIVQFNGFVPFSFTSSKKAQDPESPAALTPES